MLRENLNITTHSGGDGSAPDSIESVLSGRHLGADIAEVDVRTNKKGRLILSHDEDTRRIYSGHPFLEEVFSIVAQDTPFCINCDIKEPGTVAAVLHLAQVHEVFPEKIILTGSVRPSMLEIDPGITKCSQVWLNIEEIIEDYYLTDARSIKPYRNLINPPARGHEIIVSLDSRFNDLIDPIIADCKDLGVKVINMPLTEQTSPVIPYLLSRGIQVSVWTINEEKTLGELFGLGVINVTTRNTRMAVKVRNAIMQGPSLETS